MSVSFTSDDYDDGFAPFQSGWKQLQVTDFGEDENSSATGRLAWFEFTVLEGDDKGRAFRSYYNYIHNKEEAEKIARGQLCTLGKVCGVKQITIPEGLGKFKGKKFKGHVVQKKGDDFPKIKEFAEPDQSEFGFGELETPNDFAQSEMQPTRAAKRDPFAS